MSALNRCVAGIIGPYSASMSALNRCVAGIFCLNILSWKW